MVKNGKKISLVLVIGVLLIGAMLGGFLGELIKLGLPDGVVKDVFLRAISISFGPMPIDLLVFNFVIGLTLKFNITAGIGFIVAYYLLRYWR
ncbi:MAG: DUF4321 domain-containing protein [Candidatus Marinimicrobia bacterium]|nr:DUF4321 domain-containing protein [Candidatus Neomarinimicrobiota bacterium]